MGTNSSGFSAVPAGIRTFNRSSDAGEYFFVWSSTENGATDPACLALFSSSSGPGLSCAPFEHHGYGVCCAEDQAIRRINQTCGSRIVCPRGVREYGDPFSFYGVCHRRPAGKMPERDRPRIRKLVIDGGI